MQEKPKKKPSIISTGKRPNDTFGIIVDLIKKAECSSDPSDVMDFMAKAMLVAVGSGLSLNENRNLTELLRGEVLKQHV